MYELYDLNKYEPEVNDYVIWDKGEYGKVEGWVYFKGDPVDNEQRVKHGWNPLSQYITIEIGVRDKHQCVYTSGKPMMHKKHHVLLICNDADWKDLHFVTKRKSKYDDVDPYSIDIKERNIADDYKSQEGRYIDP